MVIIGVVGESGVMHLGPDSGNIKNGVGHVGNFHANLKTVFVATEEEGEKARSTGN